MTSFELSEDTMDKLDAVRRSSNLPDNASTDKVIRVMANAHLIKNGNTDELSKLKQEKQDAEAKRDALREWIQGDGRGK